MNASEDEVIETAIKEVASFAFGGMCPEGPLLPVTHPLLNIFSGE